MDRANHSKSVTQTIFQEKFTSLLQWLGYFLLHGKSEDSLPTSIENFLGIYSEVGFKIHPKKTELFLQEANFCGRKPSADLVKHDPRQCEVLLRMKSLKMADQI